MRLKMSQLPTSSTEWGIVKKGMLFQSPFQILPLFACAGAVRSQSCKFQGESGQLRLISFISSLFCGGNILCMFRSFWLYHGQRCDTSALCDGQCCKTPWFSAHREAPPEQLGGVKAHETL